MLNPKYVFENFDFFLFWKELAEACVMMLARTRGGGLDGG